MNAVDKPKYRAFISYAHADGKWARWIQRELESYRIPGSVVREAGLEADTLKPIFRDSEDLGSSSDLSESIQNALTESETLIVVCSAEARESTWVNREIEYFLAISPERAKRVYCLLLGGGSGDDIAQVMPDALSGYEGLAADLRKGGDTPKRAKLKLVSALIGVNLDRLIQRDRTKRRHRAAILGTIGAALILMFTFLVNQSRQASLEVDEKARSADELVTFMLEDLGKRLDEFDGVARLNPGFDTALAYFESIETGDMSIETLERYFDALTSAGDLRLREGKSVDALRIWERSMEIGGRLVERNSGKASSWRRHGDAYISLALANWENPDEVILNTTKALEFFEKATEMDPDDFANHSIQVATLNNLGAGYAKLREFDAARESFVRSLAMNERLRSRPWPESENAMESMLHQEANSAAWMTEVELRHGQATAAVEWHEREVAIRRAELSNSGDPVRLGDALTWGAVAYRAIGDDLTARSKRMEAEQLFEGLMRRDPDNFYWQRRYIESTLQRTLQDIDLGKVTVAEQTLADVEQRLDRLGNQHADNVAFVRLVARMEITYAHISIDSSPTQSLQRANRAMSRLRPYLRDDGTDVEALALHAEATILASYVMMIEGRDTEGTELARTELELIERTPFAFNYVTGRQTEVILRWLAGERESGDAILAEMYDTGYRSSQLARWQERLQF